MRNFHNDHVDAIYQRGHCAIKQNVRVQRYRGAAPKRFAHIGSEDGCICRQNPFQIESSHSAVNHWAL